MIIDETAIRGSSAGQDLDRRARQHGQPRPCAGPARPQPPGGHPLESDQRAEPERPGFRTVREGPVRGDERRRRHPADHRRAGRRRECQPVSRDDVRQLRGDLALRRRLRQVRGGPGHRERAARRRGRVHLAGMQQQAGLRVVRHGNPGQARQGRHRPAPVHAAVRLGQRRARRADHRLHPGGGRSPHLRRGQPARPVEQPADPARAGGVQPGGRGRPARTGRPPALRTRTAPSRCRRRYPATPATPR